MGVDGVVVEPGPLRVADAGQVELAHRDHGVGRLAVDRVAVDVEGVRERVVLPDLLELAERVGHPARVEQPDAGDGLGVVAQLPRRRGRLRVVGRLLHPRQVVRRAGGRDVARDVRPLQGLRARADLQALHQRRIDQPDHDGAHQEQHDADTGQSPRPGPDRREEQRGADQRRGRQDGLGRQQRMRVGVGQAGDQRGVLGGELVALQPVVAGPQQHQDAEDDREVHPGGRRRPPRTALHPQAAVQVMRCGSSDPGHDDDGHQEAGDEPQPRQREDEEADVEVELRVLDVERLTVPPQQVGLPLPGRRAAGEQADHDRHRDRAEPAQRLDLLAVAVQAGLLGRDRRIDRPRAEGEDQAGEDRATRDQPTDDEEQHLGEQLGGEDPGVADRLVPEQVGPELRADQDEGHDDARGSPASAAGRRGAAVRSPAAEAVRVVRAGPGPRTTDRLPHALLTHAGSPDRHPSQWQLTYPTWGSRPGSAFRAAISARL